MGKSCRVKYQTRTFKKRGKVFCKKVSEDVNDVDNKEEEAIVNNDTVENTPNREEPDPETTPKKTKQTVSERKVEHIISATPKSIDPISGYRIIDIELLNSVFKEMRCPECTQLALSLNENVPKKMGLASSLYIECSRCLYKNEFFTSTMQDSSFDVNKRMVYTMRSCGQGYAGIEKFTMLMHMPKPMTGKNYNKLVQKFVKVTEEVAKETMEDAVNKTHHHKPGPGLPMSVITHVKPIFADLSSEKLLKDCLHGKTQNHNESFNGTIWERLPKSKFVTLPQLKFGVNDAIANFNIGRKASVLVYKKLNMVPGQYMLNNCKKRNRKRLSHSVYKDKETSKIRRKIIRGNKKKKHDRDKETEGTLYKAGSFA